MSATLPPRWRGLSADERRAAMQEVTLGRKRATTYRKMHALATEAAAILTDEQRVRLAVLLLPARDAVLLLPSRAGSGE